jgi:hypothetical protein
LAQFALPRYPSATTAAHPQAQGQHAGENTCATVFRPFLRRFRPFFRSARIEIRSVIQGSNRFRLFSTPFKNRENGENGVSPSVSAPQISAIARAP